MRIRIPATIIATTAAALAAAAFTAIPAANAATSGNTPAATRACGDSCFNLSSLLLGPTEIQNSYINEHGGVVVAHAGARLNLNLAYDNNVNEDFIATVNTTLGQACTLGEIRPASYVCDYYGDWSSATGDFTSTFPVLQGNFSPDGIESGLCTGVAAVAAGEPVTLQPCGTSGARTLWVVDEDNAYIGYAPLINAADPASANPEVLSVKAGGSKPANKLSLQPELLLTGGYVANGEMWTYDTGVEI
jgi:hypothetical protein